MTRFQLTLRCISCGHRYKRTMAAPDEQSLETMPDPPCPSCNQKLRTKVPKLKLSGQAPAVGGSLTSRAIDTTAKIVMEDHKMTDLQDGLREGDTMAPKLAPRLQAMADGMFARPNRGKPRGGIFDLPPQAVMRAAVSGRFKTPDTRDPIAVQHAKRERAPVHIVAGDGVRPAR